MTPWASFAADWFEQHPLAHLVYDLDNLRLLAVNRAAVERYGYSRDELLAMTRDQLMPPDERAAFAAFRAALPGSQQGPQRVWREVTKSGQPLRSQVRGVDIDWHGRRARVSAVMDAEPVGLLEAQARQQRELWQVAGAMAQVGGWSMTLPDRRITWSDEICAIHERPPGHVPTLDEGIAYYPGAAAAAIGAAVAACMNEGQPFDLELPFVTATGRARWVRAGGTAVRDAEGRIVQLQGLLQDITPRKQSELALWAARQRLEAVLRAVPDLWFVIDGEDRYVEVSNPADPGLTDRWESIAGRTVDAVTPQPLRQRLTAALSAARGSGEAQTFDYDLATRAGERRFYEGRVTPIDGGGCLYVTRDMTALRAAQTAAEQRAAALQASEQRLAALLRAIPTLWFVIDADDRYVEVSRDDHPDLARPWPQAIGRCITEVLEPPTATRLLAAVRECRLSGRTQRLTYAITDADGARRYFEASVVPMAEGRVLLLAYDVSTYERLQAELQHRADALAESQRETEALLRAFPDLWLVFDEANRFVDVRDPEDPRLLQPWHELRGRHIADVVPGEVARQGERMVDAARATGQVQSLSYELPGRDGRPHAFDARAVALSGGRVLLVTRDVTAQRDAEAAVRAREVAEQAARHQREFLSRMSHELRTPLNAILGFGQVLEAELPPGAAVRGHVQHIMEGGERLLWLVDRLLQMQRLQQAPQPPTPVALSDSLQRAARWADALAAQRGVRLQLSVGAAPVLQVDRQRLDQLLTHLLDEALRASPRGSTLRVDAGHNGQPRVVLHNPSVRPGSDELAGVFGPLLGAANDAEGLSLGLLIARELARWLGARFDVRCDAQAGLEVRLEFEP